jgi:hypothetical protein
MREAYGARATLLVSITATSEEGMDAQGASGALRSWRSRPGASPQKPSDRPREWLLYSDAATAFCKICDGIAYFAREDLATNSR